MTVAGKSTEWVSERDPEMVNLRQNVHWSQWMRASLCVKNELCVLAKLALRGTRILIPKVRVEVLRPVL